MDVWDGKGLMAMDMFSPREGGGAELQAERADEGELGHPQGPVSSPLCTRC